MVDLNKIEKRVTIVQHGFREMKEEALAVFKDASIVKSLRIANQLFASEKYQVRMVAVFIMGYIASESQEALKILRKKVSLDKSWQVQEILAQAFNECCKSIGYEHAIPLIKSWLRDRNPNVRRAVTEGLRIWNQRDYFRQQPEIAAGLLGNLKDDESEYVRKSVGNALRDISRKEKELICSELTTWNTSNPKIAFTYSLACKFV